jgi:hypothetical protein
MRCLACAMVAPFIGPSSRPGRSRCRCPAAQAELVADLLGVEVFLAADRMAAPAHHEVRACVRMQDAALRRMSNTALVMPSESQVEVSARPLFSILDVGDVAQHREQQFGHAADDLAVDEGLRRRIARSSLTPRSCCTTRMSKSDSARARHADRRTRCRWSAPPARSGASRNRLTSLRDRTSRPPRGEMRALTVRLAIVVFFFIACLDRGLCHRPCGGSTATPLCRPGAPPTSRLRRYALDDWLGGTPWNSRLLSVRVPLAITLRCRRFTIGSWSPQLRCDDVAPAPRSFADAPAVSRGG